MQKSTLIGTRITSNTTLTLPDVTSLTISNWGSSELVVVVNDTPETIKAYDATLIEPYRFNVGGDSTRCDIRIIFQFVGGTGNASVWYKQYKEQNCK